ncbi:MAG: NAD(P)-binding domain-containing protein, partial [Pseudomonadota bacterium]
MPTASMGLIGVGTMGSALALNMAENGHHVALYNLDGSTVDALIETAGPLAPKLRKCESVEALVAAMATPRAIMLMVPAGGPVDASIDALLP